MGRVDSVHGKRSVRFFFNNQEVDAYEGQSVAAALLAVGQQTLRKTALRGEPRGLFCGMGVCHDCIVRIDGRPSCQACLTPVIDGMNVEAQIGHGTWSTDT
jgi:D-hydroxyproline dehydrogenase subunit gamma